MIGLGRWRTEYKTKKIKEFAEKGDPFLIFVNFNNAHWPYDPLAFFGRGFRHSLLSERKLKRYAKKQPPGFLAYLRRWSKEYVAVHILSVNRPLYVLKVNKKS